MVEKILFLIYKRKRTLYLIVIY